VYASIVLGTYPVVFSNALSLTSEILLRCAINGNRRTRETKALTYFIHINELEREIQAKTKLSSASQAELKAATRNYKQLNSDKTTR